GSALVIRAELPWGNGAHAFGHVDRSCPDDHTRDALRRGQEVLDPFLRRQASDVQDMRRLLGLPDRLGDLDACRHHADVIRPQGAGLVGEKPRGADRESGPPKDPAHEPRTSSRKLDVRPPYLYDVWPAECGSDCSREEPVRMHEIAVAPCGGPTEVPKEGRHEQDEPRSRPQVRNHAVAVSDAEVPEGRWR